MVAITNRGAIPESAILPGNKELSNNLIAHAINRTFIWHSIRLMHARIMDLDVRVCIARSKYAVPVRKREW